MGGIRDMINTQKQVLQSHMQAQNLVHQNHPYPTVSVVGQGQQFLPIEVPGTMYQEVKGSQRGKGKKGCKKE